MAAPVTRIDAIKYARHERTAVNNFAKPVDDHDVLGAAPPHRQPPTVRDGALERVVLG